MPFTEEQFFQVFAACNAAISPLPPSLTSSALQRSVYWRSRISTLLIMAILALMWLVNGVGYHWSFFTSVNPAARTFGAVFVVQALLLAEAPLVSPTFRLAPTKKAMHELAMWIVGRVHDIGPDAERRQQPDALGPTRLLLSQPRSGVDEVGAQYAGADMFQGRELPTILVRSEATLSMNGEAGQKIGGETMRKSMPSLAAPMASDALRPSPTNATASSGNDLSTTSRIVRKSARAPMG